MKLKCTDNTDLAEQLTVGREYTADYSPHKIYVYVYRADDKKPGFFHPNRFEEVVSDADAILWGEPEVKINSYTLETERK